MCICTHFHYFYPAFISPPALGLAQKCFASLASPLRASTLAALCGEWSQVRAAGRLGGSIS